MLLVTSGARKVLIKIFGLKPFEGDKNISVDGETVKTVDLANIKEKFTFIPATDPRVVITAENGEIRFESAECEDKLCVACGNLSKHGDTAVCLPSKTVITITGSDVDAVVY